MSDSIGSVSVDVVPDARGWSEKLRAQIRDQTVTVNADADTGEAEQKLDKVARTRTARVKVNVDKNAAQQLDSFVGKLGLLPALAVAAGGALVPLGGVLAGIAAGLAAPLAIAGGGATLFAFLGGLAIKDTQQKLKDINTLSTKLDGLTKGTQEYRDVQSQLKVAQDNLSPSQERFATSLGNLKGTFETMLSGKLGGSLLGPFSQGMDLLSRVLPVVAPLIQSVSGAFSSLLGDLGRGAGSKGFSNFVGQMARLAAPDIVSLGHILGNVVAGIAGLLGQFDRHIGHGLLDALERLSGSFADFGANSGHSKALQSFFDYFHQVGPQVGDTIGAVARAIAHIASALAPLGPPILHVIEGIADAISAIPTPVLTSLAAAVGSLVVLQKTGGLKLAGSLLGGTSLGSKGVLGGILGSAKPVPVFVTNPGFGGVPGVPGGKVGTVGTAAEEAAAANAATKGGFLTRLGLPKLLGAALEAPALLSLANSKANENPNIYNHPLYLTGQDFKRQFAGSTTVPGADVLSQFGKGGFSQDKARSLLHIPDVRASSTAFDALKAHAAGASQAIDQIGPHAAASTATAIHSVGALQAKLNSIHDKRFAIIAQDQAAIASLQRIQAMQIADKSFNVYQHNQIIERVVGPGGGHGISNPGGSAGGAGGGAGGGSGGGAGRTPVHIHLDENGRANITGYMEGHADRVYHANRAYENTASGQ